MPQNRDDNLIDILRLSLANWKTLACFTCGGILTAIVLMLVLKPHYQAQMIIAPAIHDYQDKMLASQKFTTPMAERAAEGHASREFTKFEQTFREASIARLLLNHLRLVENVNRDGLFLFSNQHVKDATTLSDYLKRHVDIRPLGATSSRLVTYKHPDPVFAAQMLQSLHLATDTQIRNEAHARVEKRISYLQNELQKAGNPEHRQVLTDILLQEEQSRMLSSMDAPYAAELIEPPSVSLKPVSPRGCVILPLCALLGLVLGLICVLAKNRDPETI